MGHIISMVGYGRRFGGLAACLLLLLAAAPAAAQDREAVGQVVGQQGTATALHEGRPRILEIGAAVYRGDWVFTEPDAKVRIELADGSVLSVGAATRVEIAEYALGDGGRGLGGALTLILGIIRTSLSDAWGGDFEVRARAAVASVRSTDWVTESSPERTSVFVVEGTVAVRGAADGTTVTLGAGDGTDVDTGSAPSPPKKWGEARVNEVLARTEVP